MQKVIIETTQNVNIDYSIASVGDRIVAFLIDSTIKFIYLIVGIFILTSIDSFSLQEYIYMGLFLLPFVFYFFIMELLMDGQSIGKKIMRIKVIKLDNSQPTVGDYLLRWLLRLVDSLFGYGVGLITIILNENGQRIGDIASGTTVIKLNNEEEVSYHKHIDVPEEDYDPAFPQVTALSDRDIEIIKQTIKFYKESGNSRAVIKATLKIKEILRVESDLPPIKFLNIVIKDYNFLTGKMVDSY